MNKKLFTTAIALMGLCATVFAQTQTMQVMKGGTAIFETPASGSEKIVFQNPSGPATPASDDALIVQQKSGAPVTTLLDNIKEITFSGDNLSVVPFSGAPAVYAMSNIVKISFGKGATGINSPKADGIDLTAYFNPAGNIVVECEAGILSMTLIAIDGKTVSMEKFDGAPVETGRALSLQSGVYILHVETAKGTAVQKFINFKK